MMRVAIVIRARAPYLRDLQEALANELLTGELHLLWPANEDSDFKDDSATPTGKNVTIHAIQSCPVLGPRFPSSDLWSTLNTIQPDIVWIHEFSPFTLGGLLYAKRQAIPVVESTEVGRGNAHFFSFTVRAWHFLWSHLIDGVIANAPAARQSLCGENHAVVDAFHAVDSRRFAPVLSDRDHDAPVTFVVVGKLIPRKGTDLLLEAAAHLRSMTDTPFRLRFIGGDPDGWAASLTAKLGLEDCVEFKGFLEDESLRTAISTADVFVLPTRQDTDAAVVHEAACLGLPLLVSIHAGACEALVQEGVAGHAIDPADTTSFAKRMRTLCDDRTLRQRMGAASRNAGERLSAHRTATAIVDWMRNQFALR